MGELVLAMSRTYYVKRKSEFFYDALFFPLLKARCRDAFRQEKLKIRPGQRRPQRIDFRFGGNSFSPALELAHGNIHGGLGPSSNDSELQKLCRLKNATMRYLLLLDTATRLEPFDRSDLKAKYDAWTIGPGQFARRAVRVIYVRDGHSFNFIWRAKRKRAA